MVAMISTVMPPALPQAPITLEEAQLVYGPDAGKGWVQRTMKSLSTLSDMAGAIIMAALTAAVIIYSLVKILFRRA